MSLLFSRSWQDSFLVLGSETRQLSKLCLIAMHAANEGAESKVGVMITRFTEVTRYDGDLLVINWRGSNNDRLIAEEGLTLLQGGAIYILAKG